MAKAQLGGQRIGGKDYPSGAMLPQQYRRVLDDSDRPRDPAGSNPLAAPNLGRFTVPQLITFSSISTTLSKAYRNPDEAYRHSIENAHMMLSDPTIAGPLYARQMMTSLLQWSVESEDDKDPQLKAAALTLSKILEKTPRFTELRRSLLEAIWYGRSATQQAFGFHTDRHRQRFRVIKKWAPVSGDKLLFRYDDGSYEYDPDQIGVRMAWLGREDALAGKRRLEPTSDGLGYFLKPWERRHWCVHKHMIRDGEYEDPLSAGQIHGVGLRHFLYWTWYQKQETMAQVVEVIERTGMGITIYYYPLGNAEAEAQVKKVAQEQAHTNILAMPYDPATGGQDYNIQQIPPNTAGLQVLTDIVDHYYGDMIVRFILGQTLSSKPSATGMNTGVADLQKDSLYDIVRYDAVNLQESITREILLPLRDFNLFQFRSVEFFFKISTKVSAPQEELAAIQQAWQMGAKIRVQDLFAKLDLAMPDKDDKTVFNPQIVGAIQQVENPSAFSPPGGVGPQPPGATPSSPGPMDQNEPLLPEGAPPEGEPEQLDKAPDPAAERQKLFGPILYAKRADYLERIREAVENTEPNPSEAQRAAGNYAKGKAWLHGIEVVIETPCGQPRKPGWKNAPAHYGYMRRLYDLKSKETTTIGEGKDQDHIDVFIGPCPESELAFVIDQVAEDGQFDEWKVVLGCTNQQDAEELYLSAYPDGWKCGPISTMTVYQLRRLLADGKKREQAHKQQYSKGLSPPRKVSGIHGVGADECKMPQSSKQEVSTVRRKGHRGLRQMETKFPGISSGHGEEAWDRPRVLSGEDRQQRGLLPSQLHLGSVFDPVKEQIEQPILRDERQTDDPAGLVEGNRHSNDDSSFPDQKLRVESDSSVDDTGRIATEELENAHVQRNNKTHGTMGGDNDDACVIARSQNSPWVGHRVSAHTAIKSVASPSKYAKDALPGGRADNVALTSPALAQGTAVELEHTDNPAIASEIASDHLVESPAYYDALKRMEAALKANATRLRKRLEYIKELGEYEAEPIQYGCNCQQRYGKDDEDSILHLLGHIGDSDFGRVSESPEWLSAWQSELNGGALSGEAAESPAEGLAEYIALVLRSPQEAHDRYPDCWEVLEISGLVEEDDDSRPERYAYEESEHPRDQGGRWTEKDGGGMFHTSPVKDLVPKIGDGRTLCLGDDLNVCRSYRRGGDGVPHYTYSASWTDATLANEDDIRQAVANIGKDLDDHFESQPYLAMKNSKVRQSLLDAGFDGAEYEDTHEGANYQTVELLKEPEGFQFSLHSADESSSNQLHVDPKLAAKFLSTGRAAAFRIHDAKYPLPDKSRNTWHDDENEFMPGVSGYANLSNAIDDLLFGETESVTGDNYASQAEDPVIVVMNGKQHDGPGAEMIVESPKVAAVIARDDVHRAFQDWMSRNIPESTGKSVEELLNEYSFDASDKEGIEAAVLEAVRKKYAGGRTAGTGTGDRPSPDIEQYRDVRLERVKEDDDLAAAAEVATRAGLGSLHYMNREPLLVHRDDDGRINGVILADTDGGLAFDFAVDPDSQGGGIGTKLVQGIIGYYLRNREKLAAKQEMEPADYDLTAIASNPVAEQMLLKAGFRKDGEELVIRGQDVAQ